MIVSIVKYFVCLLPHKIFIWRQLYGFKVAAARRGMRPMLRLDLVIWINILVVDVHIAHGEEILVEVGTVLRLLAKGPASNYPCVILHTPSVLAHTIRL